MEDSISQVTKKEDQKIVRLFWFELEELVQTLRELIRKNGKHYTGIYAIPRGGNVVATMLSYHLNIPLVKEPEYGCLIVDDIIDSGKTIEPYVKAGYDIACVVRRHSAPFEPTYKAWEMRLDHWIIFPWEVPHHDGE